LLQLKEGSHPHTTASTCIRQHTSAYVSIRRRGPTRTPQPPPAYANIRQHTSSYVSIRRRGPRGPTRTPQPPPACTTRRLAEGKKKEREKRGYCRLAVTRRAGVCSRMLAYAHVCSKPSLGDPPPGTRIRQHTREELFRIRQHTREELIRIRQHTREELIRRHPRRELAYVSIQTRIRQHREEQQRNSHTSAYKLAYVSIEKSSRGTRIRQHTRDELFSTSSFLLLLAVIRAYVSILEKCSALVCCMLFPPPSCRHRAYVSILETSSALGCYMLFPPPSCGHSA
jgi:hypothetical protein